MCGSGASLGPGTIERLAALVDADGELTGDRLRADFPDWRIWHSDVTGCWHATLRCAPTGRYREVHGDPRRFHQAAPTLGRLAVRLLAQTAADLDLADTDD